MMIQTFLGWSHSRKIG